MLFNLPFSNVRPDHYSLCLLETRTILSFIAQQLNE